MSTTDLRGPGPVLSLTLPAIEAHPTIVFTALAINDNQGSSYALAH